MNFEVEPQIEGPLTSQLAETEVEPRPAQNAEFIKDLFGSIACTYDRANDVITFGMARLWRRQLVEWSVIWPGQSVLDCATGTGDLAIEFKKAVGPEGRVVGTDFCAEMLTTAPEKALRHAVTVEFAVADAMALPYKDGEFHVTSIAYGIRNVADVSKALNEMARVTRSGGRVMILETGEIENPILRRGIRFYFEKIVPRLGGLVSGKPEAYNYLQKSSGDFPSGEKFCDILRATDRFSSVEFQSIMGGASFMYKAVVK